MCNATTKSGSQCKIQTGLIDGLCFRHRESKVAKGNFVIIFMDEKTDEARAVGPFKSAAEAEKELSLYDQGTVVELTAPPKGKVSKKSAAAADKPQCAHTFSRGKRVGEQCTKKCAAGKIFCSTHTPKEPKAAAAAEKAPSEEEIEGCSHMFIRGARKGQCCGKPVIEGTDRCRTHGSSAPKKEKVLVPNVSDTEEDDEPDISNLRDLEDKINELAFELDEEVPEVELEAEPVEEVPEPEPEPAAELEEEVPEPEAAAEPVEEVPEPEAAAEEEVEITEESNGDIDMVDKKKLDIIFDFLPGGPVKMKSFSLTCEGIRYTCAIVLDESAMKVILRGQSGATIFPHEMIYGAIMTTLKRVKTDSSFVRKIMFKEGAVRVETDLGDL